MINDFDACEVPLLNPVVQSEMGSRQVVEKPSDTDYNWRLMQHLVGLV